MSRSSSLFVAVAAATTAVLGLVSSPAPASAANLGQIIQDNGFIINGDKKFSNFKFFGPTCIQPAPQCTPKTPFDVGVNPYTDPFGNLGLIFNDTFHADGGILNDISLQYDVEVLDKAFWISDIHSFVQVNEDEGTVKIDESLFSGGQVVPLTSNGKVFNVLTVDNKSTTPLIGISNWADLVTPVKKLTVLKDINYKGFDPVTGNPEEVDFTIFTQTFSQKPESVPEPGAVVGLLAIGSFGVSEILKRHKKAK